MRLLDVPRGAELVEVDTCEHATAAQLLGDAPGELHAVEGARARPCSPSSPRSTSSSASYLGNDAPSWPGTPSSSATWWPAVAELHAVEPAELAVEGSPRAALDVVDLGDVQALDASSAPRWARAGQAVAELHAVEGSPRGSWRGGGVLAAVGCAPAELHAVEVAELAGLDQLLGAAVDLGDVRRIAKFEGVRIAKSRDAMRRG